MLVLFAKFSSFEKDMSVYSIVSGNFIFGDLLESMIIEQGVKVKTLYISTLSLSENNVDFKIESYLRKPNYVPFQKKIIDAFLDMQNINSHIAIVIDEYGGTAG